jgi:deoxyribonuclease V
MASHIHNWNVSPTQAIAIQKDMQLAVRIEPLTQKIKYIGGADVSMNRFHNDIFAGIVVLSYPDLVPVTYAVVKSKTDFPYIPGLLSFREAPTLVEVWKKLSIKPDVLMVDGQGIAHPRRLGIATHLGIVLDIPTVGCAKSLLYGKVKVPLQTARSFSYITDPKKNDEVIGALLRTKDNVKPVVISAGHRIDLETSLDITRAVTRGYRLPEPTRRAHILVNNFRTNHEQTQFLTF